MMSARLFVTKTTVNSAMPLISASQTEHTHLYHYQIYSETGRVRLESTLRDRAIYLPSPSSFNDPWDCRPWFDLTVLDDEEMRERHIDWFIRYADRPDKATEDEIKAGSSPIELDGRGMFADAWRIDQPRIPLVLSDAEGCQSSDVVTLCGRSQGFCLQFDARIEPIAGAFKVSYHQDLPHSIVPEHSEDAAAKSLLSKSDVWDYEEEFRLIARDARTPAENFLIATDGIVPIGDRSLVGIIIGCQCDSADEIIDMVRQRCRRPNPMYVRPRATRARLPGSGTVVVDR